MSVVKGQIEANSCPKSIITICLSNELVLRLKKVRNEIGVPVSHQIERILERSEELGNKQ